MPQSKDIFAAIEADDRAEVENHLARDPALVNARNERGDSPLLTAAYFKRKEILAMLIERGAAVSLFEASALGLKEVAVDHLRREPASVNSYSHDGWTPLHLASFFGHRDLAELLLERGADVNARSRSERFARENTPLHAAAA